MDASKPSPALLACFDAGYDAIAPLRRDLFGLSAFPSRAANGKFSSWYLGAALGRTDAPVDKNVWLVSSAYIEDAIVVNAVNSTSSGKQPKPVCVAVQDSSMEAADAWFATLVAQATASQVQLVTLAQARDILPQETMGSCPCAVSDPQFDFYCNYLNFYRQLCYTDLGIPSYICEAVAKLNGGTAGVRDLTYAPKQPLYDSLQQARAATVAAPAEGLRKMLQ